VGGGGESNVKRSGILVVALRGVNAPEKECALN